MPTRYERNQVVEQRARQARQRRYILIGLGIVGGVIVVAGLILVLGGMNSAPAPGGATAAPAATAVGASDQPLCTAVQTFPTQGAEHIAPNQPHAAYNSNPPTSGWHWANPQDWGIYTTQQVQDQLVHNLEHGGIVMQYRDLSAAEVQRLTDLVKSDSRHMILAPYPALPEGKVALTAWMHLQLCKGIDENAIRAFVRVYRDQGPEFIP